MGRTTFRVKDVARIGNVSVRTLHHYDEVGLLVPRTRTDAGYRLYSLEELLRLHQILLRRAMGMSLEDRSIEAALTALDPKAEDLMDVKKLFDGFDPSTYEVEAKTRWGNTSVYKESSRRTRNYTAEDWTRQNEEQSAIYLKAAQSLKAGDPPSSAASMAIAEEHRRHIDRWFYPCTRAMHEGLAMMYESDQRFTESMDRHGEGLATFLAAAIRANATRGES